MERERERRNAHFKIIQNVQIKSQDNLRWFRYNPNMIPSSYCSTIAGTRPHFPAVYTCPPSTAIASASFFYTEERENDGRWETRNTKLGKKRSYLRIIFYHNLLHTVLKCVALWTFNGGVATFHTADAPEVTLGCLSMTHRAPFQGSGGSAGYRLWEVKWNTTMNPCCWRFVC